MKVAHMRAIDRWLGVPACFVLSCLRRMGSLLRRPPDGPVRSILFVKLVEQGTTVLAHAALRKAVDMVGAGNVYFLVFEENRPIVDLIGLVPPENVIGIRAHGLLGTCLGALSALRRLRALRPDAAVDLEFFARSSACLCYLSGARRRVGFHSYCGEAPYRGSLMTQPVLFNAYVHTSQAFLMLVLALEAPPPSPPAFGITPPPTDGELPRFQPAPEEVESVRAMLGDGADRRILVLNPNVSDLMPLRAWPTERYVELARRLLERDPDAHVVFTGTPADEGATGRLVQAVGSDRCRSLAGRTTLRQLFTLYTLSEVLVTNDSGPAHFAALTGVDAVTLFGPETPLLFAARTPRSHVLWSGLVCSPCISAFNNRTSKCRDNICMQSITVDQVFDKVCQVLAARAERGPDGRPHDNEGDGPQGDGPSPAA